MATRISNILGSLFKSRRRAVEAEAPRKVWRMSGSEPRGAWVDPLAPAPPPDAAAPVGSAGADSSGWLTSSMDLLGGAEVVEHGNSVVPEIFPETATSTPRPTGQRKP